ncbi:DUF2382 domain-containing protein [Deinococcus sp. Arct2-2]|uniref:YsnF/AvaK domain-containing protein n=1 Tax=Deinococcus sp. Arct2-2 TaxID=2568653 RepID=UPI0010A31576|nr:YsnF/AvaK domain-containing protein [Deinococcus sp. Arct2-2]THF71641.1 DUF2382 domain-containing protein [Deinococcus sp. Arct2-2]
MTHLHRLSQISNEHSADFQDAGMYSPVGSTAYLSGKQQLGMVRDALVDDDYGKLRYLIVDQDGGDLNGAVLLPIGLARFEDDGVYFDDLTTTQLTSLHRYSDDEDYTFDDQNSDERVLRGADLGAVAQTTATQTTATEAMAVPATATATAAQSYDYRDQDTSDKMFKAPERLQLLEERLSVNKEKYLAGSVQVTKHVETREEKVQVPVMREEVIIERHAVTDSRPVEGQVQLGSGSETLRVDVEAERANVSKEAFVTEEVEIGKRVVTTQEQVTGTVGREVLDVNQTGDARITDETEDQQNKR